MEALNISSVAVPQPVPLWLERMWSLLLQSYIWLRGQCLICSCCPVWGVLTSIGKAFSLNLLPGESLSSTYTAGREAERREARNMCLTEARDQLSAGFLNINVFVYDLKIK